MPGCLRRCIYPDLVNVAFLLSDDASSLPGICARVGSRWRNASAARTRAPALLRVRLWPGSRQRRDQARHSRAIPWTQRIRLQHMLRAWQFGMVQHLLQGHCGRAQCRGARAEVLMTIRVAAVASGNAWRPISARSSSMISGPRVVPTQEVRITTTGFQQAD